MNEYLRLRLRPAESHKRYNLFSKQVKARLNQESKVSNEEEFKKQISDDEQWRDAKIISVQKRTENEVRVVVWCKTLTERPNGGKLLESQRELLLVKEGDRWWLDGMFEQGEYYYP